MLGAAVVGLLVLSGPAEGQEVGCPAGTYLDTGPTNGLRPPGGFCRCPDGEVLGFVATDGSGFHLQPSDDGECGVSEVAEPEPAAPVVQEATDAADLVPLPAARPTGGAVLPRTG